MRLMPQGMIDRLALQWSVDQDNQCRLPGATIFLCLLNGLLNHPELSLRMLADTYEKMTGHTADHSSFGKRLAQISPSFFAAIFDHLYQNITAKHPADAQALRLRFVDATVINLSAKLLRFGILFGAGPAAKEGRKYRQVKAVFELSDEGLPNLLRLCRHQAENADAVALGDPIQAHNQAGDLWVFDKGCHKREVLFALAQAGSFFLTPHGTQSLRVLRCLCELTATAMPPRDRPPAAGEPDYVLVRAEEAVFQNSVPDPRWQTMPLVVVHGLRYDQRRRAWNPLVLMSNLPLSQDRMQAGGYSFEELAALYRRRWEIETFFRFLKQNLGYRHLLSRSENGIEVMIYMSLIASLLLIWYRRQKPRLESWRSAKFWLTEDVRQWTQIRLERTLQTKTATAGAPPGR